MTAQKIIGLILVSFIANLNQMEGNVPPSGPAIGDIKLVQYSEQGQQLQDYYQVLVYYTDGIVEPEYREICPSVDQSVGKVICRQLGYSDLENVDVTSRTTVHHPTVWFNNTKCDDTSSHILQCKHDFVPTGDSNTCDFNPLTMIVRCDVRDPVPQHPYDGEIRLCAPDNHTNYIESDVKVSVSFGVVRLYLDEHSVWRGINQFSEQTGLLGSVEADTICKQMGYTGAIPGSAIARSASSYTFDTCYKGRLQPSAWMKTADINCNNAVPQNCLGCCYDYNSAVIGSGCAACDQHHDIIIGCTFDTTVIKITTKGTQQDCTLNSKKGVPGCARESSLNPGEIAFGTLSGVLLAIIAIILFLYIDYKCFDSKVRSTVVDYFKKKICSCKKCKYNTIT